MGSCSETARGGKVRFAGAVAIAAAVALAAAFPDIAGAAHPPSAIGTREAASTDHEAATRVAMDLMEAGGNAVDGAIGAALALGVVNPDASGIGGGGFALVYTAKDRLVTALDFRETAPAKFSADVLWPERKPVPGEPAKPWWEFTGEPNGGVVGVPGEPAGLEVLSRRFGRKSLSDAAAPAVALARKGFDVGLYTAAQVRKARDRVEASPSLASVFLPGGNPIGFGTRVRRPVLATTLERYGREGKRAIYEGATAEKIAGAVTAAGGTMTTEDLARYEVEERAPLTRTIDERTVVTMPAPSAGGLMLLEVLQMYGASSKSELAELSQGSSAYIHMLAEAMRGAYADRARIASDPDVVAGVDAVYERALDPRSIAARRATIDPDRTRAPVEFETAARLHELRTRGKGTTHLVVADRDGNVVSLTTTINGPFGASIIPEGTGILLNNELEDFTHPNEAKVFGFTDGGPNRPRPRARPVSSMTPALVFEDGRPILATGGSGGMRIATSVTQATVARLVFGRDPNACVSAPRFHTQGIDLFVDPHIPLDVREGLVRRGETVKEEPSMISAVQMIAWGPLVGHAPHLHLLAASDPRKVGAAAAR